MTDISRLSADEELFLAPFVPLAATNTEAAPSTTADQATAKSERPFVTLTYACSLDGKIAIAPGARTTLSGPETKSMTHYLRLKHDAILVGVGTAVADNPSLNCRYPGATLADQPQPIIIDPSARWDLTGKRIIQLSQQKVAKGPWVISNVDDRLPDAVKRAGAEALNISHDSGNRADPGVDRGPQQEITWDSILKSLRARGIQSLMVEGGAKVINTLLNRPELIDSVIITIAPTWLGDGSVGIEPPGRFDGERRINVASLLDTSWRQFGNDVVLCGHPAK